MNKLMLSPYQKIFFNEWKISPINSNYNIVFDQSLSGDLDIFRLQDALKKFIVEHFIFNSHVKVIDGEVYWVKNSATNQLKQFLSSHNINKQILDYINQPFDLENEPLYRFAIFQEIDGNYRFIMVIHHILIDGFSFDDLIIEISKYYNTTTHKARYSIPSQIKLIKSTSEKLYEVLKHQSRHSKVFWEKWLQNIDPIDLRFIKNSVTAYNIQNNIIKEIRFTLDDVIIPKLLQLKKDYNLSAYRFSQIIFVILINRYTSQTKLAISYPISIKEHMGLIYGAGVNTNIFPYNIDNTTTISDLINQSKIFINNLKSKNINHGYYSINDIIANTNKGNLEVAFAQTDFKDTSYNFNNVKTIKVNHEFNIDLSCKLLFEQAANQPLNYRVKYNAVEIDERILLQFIHYYKKLFLNVLTDLDNGIINNLASEYQILDAKEQQQILYKWNDTKRSFPENKVVHELFEEQVYRTPHNIAIICENLTLTYKELNEQANQLAHYLREAYQIKGDDLVALCLDRNEYIPIAILATLKAGAAYVPMDPSYPEKRISYILEDVKPKVIISNEIYASKIHKIIDPIKLKLKSDKQINLEYIDSPKLKQQLGNTSSTNPEITISSRNLAYIIYTSGTTGKPKGILIEHLNIVNCITALSLKYKIKPLERILLFANYVFDASVEQIFLALFNGSTLIIPNEDTIKDPNKLLSVIQASQITHLHTTPAYLKNLNYTNLPYLYRLISGGDYLNYELYKRLTSNINLVINEYGPTETTITATISMNKFGIGKPINNCTVYVLNNNLSPSLIGAIGELYIGGFGVARGYLNQPELTKEKFIPNPFQNPREKSLDRNTLLYKTGDLVRWLPGGDLEYIGRNDSQIKIRGFRIELGEIETVMNRYPDIQQSVVIVDEGATEGNDAELDNKNLVAYYVSDNKLDEVLLSNYLITQLPEYMIPNIFIHINEIPLTINGKLDMYALPKPEFILQNEFIAPRNDLELKVCSIFSKVLNLPQETIGVTHDFFKLGGNSILAINLLYKLQQEFKINLNDIFRFRTPEKIVASVPFTQNNLYNKLKQVSSIYDRLASYEKEHYPEMETKEKLYLQQVNQIKFVPKIKNIRGILLTGATGHLGCHILYQLLFETKYKIYLPIRAASDTDAYLRVNNKFKYYFDVGLENYQDRVIVFAADIEKTNLNLGYKQYQELVSTVDSIIHAAALVKHYGDYVTFYKANIQTTTNLLELSKLTNLKDFHYISTLSILTNIHIPNCHYYIFNENDASIGLENNINNIYIKTKYEGELVTIKYRKSGVHSNIYRVGNLSMNSKNFRNQENIEENAFFTSVRTILNLGMIPKEISNAEISPVDYTALAITKLFNQSELFNQTFHVANSHIYDLAELFAKCNNENVNVKVVPFDEFIDGLLMRLNNAINREQIERFMLHQMWLEEVNLDQLTKITVLKNKTDFILNKLDFCWPDITSDMLSDIVTQSFPGNKKMKKKEPIFEYLESIADLIPAPFYWLDITGRFVGLNELSFKASGAAEKNDMIGKNVYELYKNQEIADKLQKDINKIIQTGQSSQTEDIVVDVATGKLKYFSATRAALRNQKGEIIGILGTSIDITAEKEAENLKLQNEKQQIVVAAQEEFRDSVGQMIHDIRGPLSSLQMLVQSASELPEDKRITLREAAITISDVANQLLQQYEPDESANKKILDKQTALVSTIISNAASDRRLKIKNLHVDFIYEVTQLNAFYCIKTVPSDLRRTISNLINNAIEALPSKNGQLVIKLTGDNEWVRIKILDNGKGIPKEILEKIKQQELVTHGKEHGHGLGMQQVFNTVKNSHGEFDIVSSTDKKSHGTTITLSFPRALEPDWLAEEVNFTKDDIVVILDDDKSIHGGWASRFDHITEKVPTIKVKHFYHAKDTIAFIESVPDTDKENICFLSDYELIGQNTNGLDVINKVKIKRSMLVTSWYADVELRKSALQSRVRILPKDLVHVVPIKIVQAKKDGDMINVHMVFVDDDKHFSYRLIANHYSHLITVQYSNPFEFLEESDKYPKDTKVILDNYYYTEDGETYNIDGVTLAEKLHAKGFTKLVLLSGELFSVPEYLEIILKTDQKSIASLDKL